MNSPLAIVAMLLWVLLAFLAIGQCRRWAKSERSEKIIHQNHPAIPTKEYKLSEFEGHDEVEEKPKLKSGSQFKKPKLNTKKQWGRLATLKNSWDV
ncbi:hypothetical protein [Catalinimonas niigatensis]|uniref:hypothetical protein n=1 Tax=Catalinimonas niigatensis TaxID=1397264 RepID=UPI002666DD3B|nr:hypothetical protein [Catalinimonas niigatensis]WPP51837.1 hypothetical protein PZB72_05480 [Catalinimonas niigatensis]